MNKLLAIVFLSGALTVLPASALAEEAPSKGQAAQATHETIELRELLDSMSRKSGTDFLVDRRVLAEVVVGTVRVRDLDYAMFLTVLRNNGLAAVPSDKAVRIVPVGSVRQYALPILREDDDSVPDDEWVTRILTIENTNAVRLVPLLRPMIQQAGHLVADTDSNKLIIVAPYGVTERLADIADEVDQPASGR